MGSAAQQREPRAPNEGNEAMNDVMIKWMTAHVRVWNAMSNRRATLVAMSTWGAEPEMCKTVLGWLEARARISPRTAWERLQRDAREADVDLLDEVAFGAFKRAWLEANEHALDPNSPNSLRRWASTETEDD